MSICPKCKAEIESLINFVSGEKRCYFCVEDEQVRREEDYFYKDNKTNDFECPECSEVLFTNEGDAKKFLEDKDELQVLVEEKIKQIKNKK